MSSKKQKPSFNRTIALCYVRQSYTRTGDDTNSPERQRANIQAEVERRGWVAEWYEDVGGHRSGRSEKNRPAWLALKARLDDADVVAVVANDLSRLHRKGWRVGDLIELLTEYGVDLILAAPGREVDTTTMKGRMFLQFGAIIDEYYAEDISQRAKESIGYRKKLGKVVGLPPFGTIRNDEGYLVPSSEGAWWLPNGQFVAGDPEEAPGENILWRSYYECAEYILAIYAENKKGLEKIAYQLNIEGWPFRDRNGKPRPITREDVRRVVSNWPEYGGIVVGERSKDRPAYESYQINGIPFREDRAVFPIDLLQAVAEIRQERTVRPADHGFKREAVDYALSVITYCAHCEQRAVEQNSPKLRGALSGRTDNRGVRRYMHKAGVLCGCTNRSVRCDLLEADLSRLIKLFDIELSNRELMLEVAIQANNITSNEEKADLEQQKHEAIALCQRRLEAAVGLYGDGRISREEYVRRVEQNEREIAHWQARTTETEQIALELGMCIEVVDQLVRLWDISGETDRKGMARNLFTEIIYNLDTHRIMSFKLKPWAERFLIVRAALYEDKQSGLEEFPDRLHDLPLRGLVLMACHVCDRSLSERVSSLLIAA